MKIKRRDFLKISGMAGVALSMPRPVLNALAMEEGDGSDDQTASKTTEGQWIPSTCQSCTAWCPIEIFVQEGRAVKVRGNKLCKANNGYCCPKAHMGLQLVYDPDRIKAPVKRTNPKKGRGIDPGFVPITWDEALGDEKWEDVIKINPEDGHKIGVRSGDTVRVTSIAGSIIVRANAQCFLHQRLYGS